ncbi:hypothetical protein NDU88_005533 [Pleurodeles waltl]|uniref:Uncharacterized protein n=1 Tax=Pleurodeles waltl TaxID=8319 RepID=A0AAV7MWL7_PLEWA|nr:hypothetical protein NDU88_005533 [Pleurodeles waltl]
MAPCLLPESTPKTVSSSERRGYSRAWRTLRLHPTLDRCSWAGSMQAELWYTSAQGTGGALSPKAIPEDGLHRPCRSCQPQGTGKRWWPERPPGRGRRDRVACQSRGQTQEAPGSGHPWIPHAATKKG